MGQKTSWPRVRFPSFRRKLLTRAVRGQLVVQSWPHRHANPRHPTNAYWTEWLRQADLLWSYTPDGFRNEARVAARGKPQFPRDLAVAAMRGRLWILHTDEGRTLYPMCALLDVSASLDVIGSLNGSLLTRGVTLWEPLLAPTTDSRLIYDLGQGKVAWQTVAPGAGIYTPPAAADYTTLLGTPTPTIAQAVPGPLVLARGPNTTGNNLQTALRALDTPPRQYVYGLQAAIEFQNNVRLAITLRDSASGKLITWSYGLLSTASPWRMAVDYWNSLSLIASTPFTRNTIPRGPVFLRVRDDNVNFYFDYSADDGNWVNCYSASRTLHLASPNQQGFGLAASGTETIGAALSAFHYRAAGL